MNLFQRAHQNLPLSPSERAILKLLSGAVFTALATGLTAVAQYLATPNQAINTQVVLLVGLGAAGAMLKDTVLKYCTAHLDGGVTSALEFTHAATTTKKAVVKQDLVTEVTLTHNS